ncbi:MAG: TonB-dependent receptor plug domain-containing protein, partial [Gemmatimonadota bacterium]
MTGTVVEARSGRPIPAAIVRAEATDIAATTDVRGAFTLNGVTGTKRIVVRAVGYQPKTLDATAGDPPIRIGLEELAVKLDELVVTGTVGEAATRSLGNSIGKINVSATAEIAPPTKIQDLLSVNVPGVRVMRASGAIGSGGITRIRGSGSLSLSNEPLLYIDGVRVYNEAAVNSAAFQTFSGESPSRINDLNPEEIESIEILKGPSAATIYGTEASNGVIQIITKRGRSGKSQVEAHLGGGVAWLANPDGRYPSNYYQASDGTVKEFNVLRFNKARGYPDVFQNGSPKSAGASISGGSDRLSYFFGADYNRDEGYLSYGWQNKYNARANLTYRSSDDKFKVDVSLGAIRSKTNSQQGFQPITTSIVWACNFNSCAPDPADTAHTGYNGPGHGWDFYR